MTAIGVLLILFWLVCVLVAFILIRDFFSPDKFFIASLGFFFGDIFISEYDLPIYIIYGTLLLFFLISVVAFKAVRTSMPISNPIDTHHIKRINYFFFWLISIPPLIANLYMILSFGGIIGYINSIAMREIEFKGMGLLTMFLKMFPVINLIYFSHYINDPDKTVKTKFFFILHFVLFIVLALITTSRGSLLNNLVLMMVIYHFTYKKVSKKVMIYLAASVLVIASVLEVAREGISYADGQLITGLSDEANDQKISANWSKYGLEPLVLVTKADYVILHYGSTYLTVITNFIPRAFWPDKPDPGGVILTKEYTGDAWGGSSYLATGILPEAVINFGVFFGVSFGFIQFFFLLLIVLILYHNFRLAVIKKAPWYTFRTVKYVFIMWAAMALIVGEFTNISMDLIIKLVTVAIVEYLARRFNVIKWEI
ncbi:MAG: O-antigen polymerase [Daejeonella sp.]